MFPNSRYCFTLLLALWLSACGSFPVQEMSDARQAINAARTVDIKGKSNQLFLDAYNLLKSAEFALENGDYEKARALAVTARQKAMASRKKAINNNGTK